MRGVRPVAQVDSKWLPEIYENLSDAIGQALDVLSDVEMAPDHERIMLVYAIMLKARAEELCILREAQEQADAGY